MSQPLSINRPVPGVGRKRRTLIIGLFIISAFLYWVSLYLYVPTLPTYIHAKIENLALVGTVLSMYGLWQAVVRLPLGIAVDCIASNIPFRVNFQFTYKLKKLLCPDNSILEVTTQWLLT